MTFLTQILLVFGQIPQYWFVIEKIDLGSHHKKLRRLFIDNKILEKDRQKAIVGEQDGHIIFLYVAGRLYLKKRPENAILYGTVVIYKNF